MRHSLILPLMHLLRSNSGWIREEARLSGYRRKLHELEKRLVLYKGPLDEALQRYLHTLYEEKALIEINPLIPNDDTQGSGDTLVFTASRPGQQEPFAIIKASTDLLDPAREFAAQDFIPQLGLKIGQSPLSLGLAKWQEEGAMLYLLASECLSGRSIADILMHDSKEKQLIAVSAVGQALAELHSRGPSDRECARGQWEHAVSQMGNWGIRTDRSLAESGEFLSPNREALMHATLDLMEHAPMMACSASYTHGDLHLGNCLYDAQRQKVQWIDLASLQDSVSEEGEPQGIASWDYVHFLERLSEIGPLLGLGLGAIEELQEAFANGYALPLDPSLARFFRVHSRLFTLSEFLPVAHMGSAERQSRVQAMLSAKWEGLKEDLGF